MLRKITIIAALFSFTLAIPCAVLAGDATSSTNRREKVRQKVEIMKEKLATREATLKKKLESFRDRKKAEVVDRVNTNLNNINKKQTEQMLKHLDKMNTILDKLEARFNSNSSADAKAAIESAIAAVKTQMEKDYTLTITSESRVKTDAQKVRDQLHADLKALRQQVIAAKQSVAESIRVANSGKLEVPGKEGTTSGRE